MTKILLSRKFILGIFLISFIFLAAYMDIGYSDETAPGAQQNFYLEKKMIEEKSTSEPLADESTSDISTAEDTEDYGVTDIDTDAASTETAPTETTSTEPSPAETTPSETESTEAAASTETESTESAPVEETTSPEAAPAPATSEDAPKSTEASENQTGSLGPETDESGISEEDESLIDMSGVQELMDEKKKEKEGKVSLDYKDAELASVLRALSYSYNLNLVALKDIKGKVNISLRDVTVDEALDAILITNGYAYTRKGNIIYISPGPSAEAQGLVTKSVNIRFLPVEEAYKLLSKILSDKGSMSSNESNNSLIVSDYPATFEKIEKLLKEIDTPPPQVIIEAKIVDLQANDFKNLGVTYSATYAPGRGLFDRATRAAESVAGSVTMAGPSSDLSGGQFKVTAFTLKNFTASATLDALIQDGKAHLLASPSIATLNGKEARIVIGQRVPYKEKTTTTTGTVENTKFIDVGTTLKVLPRISADGYITMNIHPEVSSLVSNDATTGPTVNTREADVTVRVEDGETIVIGGLIKNEDNKTINRIPILGYIPVIGYLFSDRALKNTQQELAVFITPHIIRSKSERAELEKLKKPEVVVDIVPTGERNLAMIFYQRAEDLRYNNGAESQWKDKRTRIKDAIDTYLLVQSQFPNSSYADASLFKAADLCSRDTKDYERAKNALNKLIEIYPKSQYIGKSKRMLKKIERLSNRK